MKSIIILSDSWIDARRVLRKDSLYSGIGFKQIKSSKIQIPRSREYIQYYNYEEFRNCSEKLFSQIKYNELFFEIQLGSVDLDETLNLIIGYTEVKKVYLIKNMPIYELLEDFQKQSPGNQQFYKKTKEEKELKLASLFEEKGIPIFIFDDVEKFYEEKKE